MNCLQIMRTRILIAIQIIESISSNIVIISAMHIYDERDNYLNDVDLLTTGFSVIVYHSYSERS